MNKMKYKQISIIKKTLAMKIIVNNMTSSGLPIMNKAIKIIQRKNFKNSSQEPLERAWPKQHIGFGDLASKIVSE